VQRADFGRNVGDHAPQPFENLAADSSARGRGSLLDQRLRLRDRFIDQLVRPRPRVGEHELHIVAFSVRGRRRSRFTWFVHESLHLRERWGRGLCRFRAGRRRDRPRVAGDRDQEVADGSQHGRDVPLDCGRPLTGVEPLGSGARL
jgi:hypothetical protein